MKVSCTGHKEIEEYTRDLKEMSVSLLVGILSNPELCKEGTPKTRLVSTALNLAEELSNGMKVKVAEFSNALEDRENRRHEILRARSI